MQLQIKDLKCTIRDPWRHLLVFPILTLGVSCGSDGSDSEQIGAPTSAAARPAGDLPGVPPETVVEPKPAQKAPADLHFVTDLLFTGSPDAPHSLTVTFQGPSLCRWTMQRLRDEDKDRIINYRSGDRIFELPQDSQASIEYGEKDAAFILLRMELRRATMLWPDAPRGLTDWIESDDGKSSLDVTTAAGAKLGVIVMRSLAEEPPTGEDDSSGMQLFTAFDAAGAAGESLRIRERYEHEGRSWPKRFSLEIGPTEVWTETVTKLNTQTWFGEEYFAPYDRAEELAPKKD